MEPKTIASKIRPSARMNELMKLYFESSSGAEISEMLNAPNLQANNEPITYRQLNHWETEKLLPERKGGWRRFSLVEAIWVRIIYLLRQQYGIAHENIRKIKESLQVKSEKYDLFMPMMEVYLSEAVRRNQIFLFVFEDFSALPMNSQEASALLKLKSEGHIIIIDINKILQLVMPKYEDVIN